VKLTHKSVNLPSGNTKKVSWSFTLDSATCNLGEIYGDVELDGVSGNGVGLNFHEVNIGNSSIKFSASLPTFWGKYSFPNLVDGTYQVNLRSYFDPPYGWINLKDSVSVVSNSSTRHDFLKEIGVLHGAIQPEGLWNLKDLGYFTIGFLQGGMGKEFRSEDY
jgi:hypothetical protein